MKSQLPANRWAEIWGALTPATATNAIGNEVDTGGASCGTVVLTVDMAASSDFSNFEVWTSMRSDFATNGTALAAVVSDGTQLCTITSDLDNLYAKATLETAISDLTVASNSISAITEDGMYVIGVKGCGRYLNIQYDCDGPGSILGAVFIGHDAPEVPYGGAQAAY